MHRALTLIVASAAFCEVCSAVQGTDEELRRDVLEFLTTRCCGNVEARRVLTNEVRFGGDTNRLACVLSEFAQTNDDQIAEWAMWQLKKYATPAQLPFLYSCATNPVLGKAAVESVLRVEGVTSNSVGLVQAYINITNGNAAVHWDHIYVFQEMINALRDSSGEQERKMAFELILNHAPDNIFCPIQLDRLIISADSSYRQSKRRLSVLRGVLGNGVDEYDIFYVTNAISELVAYPEANLPE